MDDKNRVHCSLVVGKSNVTPLKPVTTPRLELTAALFSFKISRMLRKELDYEMKEFFKADSKTVLGYINNDAGRFQVFVGNRVQEIREHTSSTQWHYVIATEANPAEIVCRSAGAHESFNNNLRWNGPDFLWNSREDWASVDDIPVVPHNDPEVKKVSARATQTQEPRLECLPYFSNWHRVKRAIAVCLRLQHRFRRNDAIEFQEEGQNSKKRNEGVASYNAVDVQELQHAERQIIKIVQSESFRDEISLLKDVMTKL